MPKFECESPSGRSFTMVEEEGIVHFEAMLTKHFPWMNLKSQLEAIKTLPIRDDDVYIVTYPKSGTHWIWEITSMLQKGKAEYEVKVKETASVDFTQPELMKDLPSPRILNSHHPVNLMPLEVKKKNTKIIHLLRNPKDVAVSVFNMFNRGIYQEMFMGKFSDSLVLFTGQQGVYRFYNWCKFVLEWEQFTKENPDQILNLHYEDMKELSCFIHCYIATPDQDPVREIHKLKNFLNISIDDQVVEDIADACSFSKLKNANVEFKDDPWKKFSTDIMYRKGEVGDWKNWFTVAENERFDEWLSKNLANTDLKFRYEL